MKAIFAALLGCMGVVGCAGPMDRAWDDPLYRSLRDEYESSDARLAAAPDEEVTQERESSPRVTPGDAAALGGLSLDDAIRIGIANSPSLRRAGYRVDIAAGLVTQAGLYPNPAFVFAAESLGADAGRGGETNYLIEQEIVLGGRLSKARDVAKADELAAQSEFVAEEFALASRISMAYFAAFAANERLRSREELVALSERVLDAAHAQVEAGAATEQDRLRAEVVREQADIDLESARLEVRSSLRTLASTMGLEHAEEITLVEAPPPLPALPNEAAFLSTALATNNQMAQAKIAIERARRAYDLARAEATPSLFASAGPRYSDPDNETTLDVGVGIELPLFDRNQGNIRAAIAERLSTAAALREVQLRLVAEVAEAWGAYQVASLTVLRYDQQLLPKAERTLELTREAYERGKADYLRLLDAQQVVIESRIAYVDAMQRLHEAATLLRQLAQTEAPWRRSFTASSNGGTRP